MINFKYCENSLENLIKSGVIIPCPQTVIIEKSVKISKDTVIMPNTVILGDTEIGENCIIGPNSYIKDSKIKSSTTLNNTQCFSSEVGSFVSAIVINSDTPTTEVYIFADSTVSNI